MPLCAATVVAEMATVRAVVPPRTNATLWAAEVTSVRVPLRAATVAVEMATVHAVVPPSTDAVAAKTPSSPATATGGGWWSLLG